MKQPLAPLFAVFTALCLIFAPAGAQAQTCGGECPPGTVPVDISGPPAFKDCTAAYNYYTGERYEYLLILLSQNEALFSPAYQAVCERRVPEIFDGARQVLAANRARLTMESDAITAIMAELIRSDITNHVPASCRDDKEAQDQAIIHMVSWLETIRDSYKEQALDYAENSLAATLECRHLISTKAAYIYGLDFKNDIMLGTAAAHAYMLLPDSEEMKDRFVRYKAIKDKIPYPQTARIRE